jgi:hypothetical protein
METENTYFDLINSILLFFNMDVDRFGLGLFFLFIAILGLWMLWWN